MVDAAPLIRSAREQAHMSARDLAAATGVSASTVTRIERGEVNPTVVMLERLLEASGNQLNIGIVESFGAGNVRVFGSIARGDTHDDSDIDLLIDVRAGTGSVTIERIAEAIEADLPWSVDVVTSGAARERMAHILDEAVPLGMTIGDDSTTSSPQPATPRSSSNAVGHLNPRSAGSVKRNRASVG